MLDLNQKFQEDKNETIGIISDVYKSIYGFRPRSYNFQDWSINELDEFLSELYKQADEEFKAEEEFKKECILAFKKLLTDLQTQNNISEDDALRWLIDGFVGGDEFDYYTIEGFLRDYNILYSDYGSEIKNKLEKIFNEN